MIIKKHIGFYEVVDNGESIGTITKVDNTAWIVKCTNGDSATSHSGDKGKAVKLLRHMHKAWCAV